MVRLIVLLALLAGLGWWLREEEGRGRFQQVDETFLDVMLANARDHFNPSATSAGEVVFLPIKETDREEYAHWPPAPVDYQMILRGLLGFTPSVVIVTDPLTWPEPESAMVQALQDELLKFPGIILTATSGDTASDESQLPSPESVNLARERLGSIKLVSGSADVLPQAQLNRVPLPPLMRAGDLSLLSAGGVSGVELICGEGGKAIPSPALLALLHALKLPLAGARAVVDAGPSLTLSSTVYLPLQNDASLLVDSEMKVTEQNALDLMTAGMLDGADDGVAQRMGKDKVVVIGIDSAENHRARDQARALMHALALPCISQLGGIVQMAIWGVAACLGLSLLRVRRASALRRALLFLLLALVISFLAFQMARLWFPPAIPAALLLFCGLYCRLFNPNDSPTDSHG
ncbi:MAG: hypothetical protein JNJ83_10165 [Verrucomicrobiaceae bacterium]|nr:hypothetical protein [Verrucomicrobiaceae bacterium]